MEVLPLKIEQVQEFVVVHVLLCRIRSLSGLVCEWNMEVWLFKWKALSSIFLWWCTCLYLLNEIWILKFTQKKVPAPHSYSPILSPLMTSQSREFQARMSRQLYLSNFCLTGSISGMQHCVNVPTVFLFRTKSIKRLTWTNKWPRKPNVCFSFILPRFNLCYYPGKPFPRGCSWTAYVFYSSSLITFGHLFVCANGGKDTQVTKMIMWLSRPSAITTQLNTQSSTG